MPLGYLPLLYMGGWEEVGGGRWEEEVGGWEAGWEEACCSILWRLGAWKLSYIYIEYGGDLCSDSPLWEEGGNGKYRGGGAGK